MSPTILYEAEEPVRVGSFLFALTFGGIWFAVWGYGLLVAGSPITLDAIIATVVLVLLEGLFIAGIVHGGVRYLQVNDEAVLWHGPLEGKKAFATRMLSGLKFSSRTAREAPALAFD